jgi:hypothetical protein
MASRLPVCAHDGPAGGQLPRLSTLYILISSLQRDGLREEPIPLPMTSTMGSFCRQALLCVSFSSEFWQGREQCQWSQWSTWKFTFLAARRLCLGLWRLGLPCHPHTACSGCQGCGGCGGRVCSVPGLSPGDCPELAPSLSSPPFSSISVRAPELSPHTQGTQETCFCEL